jgi:hypothetical protein
MEEHCHASTWGDDGRCGCGVEMCNAMSPDRQYGCTLEKGHPGPHTNTWAPGYGTWEDKFLQNTLDV